MPDRGLILPFPTHDLVEWNGRQVEKEADEPLTSGASYLAASARGFHITCLQHWIDLCA
jgi:hypothetical protein